MTSTRVVRLRPGLQREASQNSGTAVLFHAPGREPLDAKQLFIERFAVIREAVGRHQKQGVLVLAFDDGDAPLGELWLEASLDRTRAGIAGRHSLCDLYLSDREARVSLRHAALLVRAIDLHDVRVRVIDLHTGAGFTDEAGRSLQALSADGPMFLRIGQIQLVFLRTPELGGFPDDPEQAYGCLPERVFAEEIEVPENAAPPRRRLILPRSSGAGDHTVVRATSGPVLAARELLIPGEAARGVVTVRAGKSVAKWRVGESSLARGVLIGRYERCQLGAVSAEDVSSLSRVHLMLIEDGGDVLAIDTASSNGTHHHGREKRIVRLEDGDLLDLGGELELVWNTEA